MLLLVTGFCFDTGTNIEIAGKVTASIIVWALFIYFMWLTEIKEYFSNHTFKQVSLDILKILFIIIVTCLILIGFITIA